MAPPPSSPDADWKEIDRLVSEQKFEEAAALAARRKQAARERGDEAEWTRALIREVQLRTGLHGYETAVRFLKEEPWPKGLLGRAALELFYAQSLVNYFHAYSWEIQQRERVESSGAVDLKAWTATQIYGEAARAYLRLWKDREALGREDVKALPEFLEPNSYPSGVRGTLRDALSYLFAAHLADTSGWSPAQSNEVFRLDLPALLRSGQARSVSLDDEGAHPLVRLAAVLDDLETWHYGRGEREGAFEAYLERLRRLFASFSEEEDRRRIEKALEERLSSVADVAWFAMGKAQLAEFVERPDLSGDLVRARAIAEEGRRAYPDSVGGRRCLAIVKRIEAPEYQIHAMQSDGPGRRSILVRHKNVRSLRFRAFALDLARARRDREEPVLDSPQRGGASKARRRPDAPGRMERRAAGDSGLPLARDVRDAADEGTRPLRRRGLGRRQLRGERLSARGRELPRQRPRPGHARDHRERGRSERLRGPGPLGRDRQAGRGSRDGRLPVVLEPGADRAGRLEDDRREGTGALRVSRGEVRRRRLSSSPGSAATSPST